uniref:HECT-type E3 ubiquitin transferase n=2 Tax=Caenorhabditis japonica TaxID=281687 RepID=A0A8R1DL01_CAEJA
MKLVFRGGRTDFRKFFCRILQKGEGTPPISCDERIRAQEVINAFRDEAPIHLALVQQAIGGSAAPAAGSTSAAIPNVEEIERRLNEHLSEVSHDDVLSGDELVRSAQRVLDTMGLVSISEQLSDACPNDGSEMSSERVVNAALDLVRNSRTPLFEENIATPLIPPLSQLKIDQDVSLNSACKQLFPLVNRLLLVSNDTIHPCAELIISIFPAMTEEWRKEHLIATIIGQDLIKMLGNLVEQEVDDNEVPRKHEVARTMANRLHFAVLIFDKVGEEYVEWINSTTIVDNMLKSLDYLVRRINNVEYYQSLITRIVCWFDFYAKIQRFISRRKFLKSLAPTLEWHFQQVEEDTLRRRAEFPNGERKWVAFDQQSQKILNDAFFSGVRWAKLSLKRPGRTPRKTEVDFITMKHFDGNTSTSRENVKADLPANVDINIKDLMTSEASLSFTNVNNDRLLRLATDVIRSGNLDPKCSHSMLSFIARLTRAPHNANQFLENGGVEALLQLRARCSPTYPFLVSMILRHCIDDDSMSSVIYEKTLRAYIASSSPQSSSSVADYSPSKPKDFVETLQLFSAMSSWNPLVFTEVINKIARTQDNDIVLMTKEKEKKATSGPTTSSTCTSSSHPTVVENNYRSLKVVHLMIIEIFEGHFPTSGSGQSRMLSKEKILSILSEIIKSYPSLAVVISEMRHGEQAEMTVMHKLIDTYVSPSPENVETANALKTLIAVISAAQNASKAQESLVMDIKNALASYSDKALDMRGEGVILQQENELRPEEREAAMNAFKTDEKEVLMKIQDLCAIIVTMCQSCPPQHHHHHHHHHHTTSDRNRSHHQNSVMKLFHKKKICADLVKTIHSLQLGTKESLDTVNQILKTLDTLLEGAGQNQNSLPALPRSFIEMVAGRRAGTRDREVAGGVGVHERQDLDNLIGHDAGFAFDGEMRQLLRRLNDETFRGVGVGAGAARARVAQQAGDDNDGEEEEEEEEEGSETSETSQNDAVQGNEEGVEVVVAEAIPVPIQEDEHEEDENLRVDIIGEEEDGEEEDNEDDDDDDDADDDGDGEDDEEDSEGDQGEQPGGGVGPHIIDLDDIDEDADDEEDERLEQEIMNDDEGAVRILQAANGEPSRRLLVDDDEDDDDDGDEDSMEDDGARLDLDDDYFGIGGHFGDIHRVDDMLFQHSFGRGPISAIADIFRDEIDYFFYRPSYRPERRLTAPRSTFGVVSEHPLLTRPPSDSDVPRRLPPTSYRAEILMHGPGGRTALHRQNAIRRTTTETRELEAISRGIRMSELQPGRMVVRGGEVLHPTSFFDHIFDIRPTNVSFSQRMAAYRNYNSAFQDSREERRDARATQVPNILERLDSYMNSMDPVSVRFVTVIVNSLLTKFHKAREAQIKKEAEAKAKAKKEAESAKKAAEEKKLGAHIRRHAQAAAAASPATLAETPAPTPAEMGLATPATTNTTITVSDTVAPTPASASSGAEPMETGDEVPQSSAATAASSVAGVEELEEDAPEAVPPPSQDQEPPAAPSEEFREILGDIDVPDGVDPAFLAALPEEMRAEVIRDYQRQQRAERASRPVAPAPAQPAASAAAAPADGADAPPQEEAPAAPLVEPIDPVFLNALPPELQEEVLAEHERRLREAEEQQRRRQNATAAPVVEMDGAAVIASLPLNERAQVLAEMDETELAGLPSEMQNEARRARATHIEPNLAARYQRFLFRGAPVSAGLSMRGGGGGRGGAARPVANAGPVVGAQAGNAYQAPSDHAHLLDRESILTLCMLYLVDNNRVPHTRLQKVLRSACVNQATCDFIIWCLLALLDKASDANSDDEEINSIVPAYLDSIAVSGVGHNERALRIAENAQKVSIHSMLAVPMCKNILDLLASIARAYPGNFLPALLRRGAKPADVGKQSPTFHQFWTMVQNSSKAPKTKECTATPEQQLESCPLGQMLDSLQKPTMAKSPLKEKVLKVASQIMVTLPMDTLSLLKAKRDDDDDGEDKKPLSQKLEYVIRVMTTGSCATEGLNDGLTILSEAMRTFDDSTSITIYDHLFSAVTKLGEQLLPQIDHLIVELDEAQSQSQSQVQKLEEGLPSEQPSTSKTAQLVVDISGRTATGRFDGERLVIDGDQNTRLQMSSCKELQLPAVTVLTDKGGAQYALLSALQTLVKVRTYMKAIRKDKAKREAKKSKEPSVDTPAPTEDVANEGTVPPPPAEAVTVTVTATEEGEEAEEQEVEEPRISERLASLESLWCSLSECLLRLGKASDPHAVLALQPAAEAFFLVHASQQQQQQQHKSKKEAATEVTKRTDGGQSTSTAVPAAVATSFSHEGLREDFDPDTTKLIEFAEKHRQVLNQALRQNNAVLSTGGPFAILTQFPKLLDFDVKRKFFRKELTKLEPSKKSKKERKNNLVTKMKIAKYEVQRNALAFVASGQ